MGLYYAGRGHWVGSPESALDLGSIEQAKELSSDESFVQMEIVVIYDDPTCELVLPIRCGNAAEAERPPPSA